MEVHIQKCQHCRSRNLRNVLFRDQDQKVFVQCRDCGELVARYSLSKGGYFHAGKGFESFLRSLERDGGDTVSAKDLNDSFEELEKSVEEEYGQLKKLLDDAYGKDIP